MPEGIVHNIQNNGIGLHFTPNIALSSVPLSITGTPLIGDTPALTYFTLGESVAIESVIIILPYQFGQGETAPLKITLGWVDKNANAGTLDQFGSNGALAIPDVNQSFPLENFIETPSGADSPWTFRITSVAGWVNMFNTPTPLDAVVQRYRISFGVRHFFDMVS